MPRASRLIGTLLMLLPLSALAADPLVFSGPQVGERLPPLKVVLASGDRQGQQIDLASQGAGKPILLVLVSGANRPAARLTRALLNYAEMYSDQGLSAALIWLDDDRSAAQQYLTQAISWWGVGVPVGISLDGGEGPGSYGLNRNVNVTVLVARDGRVTANFALVQPSETDAPKILSQLLPMIDAPLPTTAEIIYLSLPTRRPDNAPWKAASPDVQLRRLICGLLRSRDGETAQRAAASVEQYVADHKARQESLAHVASLLGQGRTRVTSIPAVRYLRQWSQEAAER